MDKKDPAISFEWEGTRYVLKLKDFRASDDRKLRDVIGMSVGEAWTQVGKGALDAFTGLLWLMRIRKEPDLDFDVLADKISYYDLETVRDNQIDELEAARAGKPGPVDLNPEATGASS